MRLATITRPRFNQAAGRAFCSTKQTIALAPTAIAAAGFTNVYLVDLTALPQWTSLSALYDLVRVKKVKMTFLPSWSAHDFAVGTTGSLPLLHTVIDHEIPTAASKNTAQLQEYSNYRFQQWDRPIVRSFVPAYSLSGTGTTGSASQPSFGNWMSTEAMTSSNKGAGIYYNCDTLNITGGSATFSTIIEIFVEFKSMT